MSTCKTLITEIVAVWYFNNWQEKQGKEGTFHFSAGCLQVTVPDLRNGRGGNCTWGIPYTHIHILYPPTHQDWTLALKASSQAKLRYIMMTSIWCSAHSQTHYYLARSSAELCSLMVLRKLVKMKLNNTVKCSPSKLFSSFSLRHIWLEPYHGKRQ